MIDSLGALPPLLREKLASALDTGLLPRSPCATTLRSVLGLRTGGEELVAGLRELETLGVTGSGAAAWLRALTRVGNRNYLPDLVCRCGQARFGECPKDLRVVVGLVGAAA